MTHIRSALAAALLTFGAAAIASAQTANPAPQAPRAQHAQRGPRAHARRGERALFKGIKLSDAEKANLKAVRAKYEPQMQALREQSKPQMQAMRDARQRGDTAALKALREKNAGHRDANRKLFDAERADLRAALAPENQAKFDANVQQLQSRFAQRGAHAHKRAGREAGSTAGK